MTIEKQIAFVEEWDGDDEHTHPTIKAILASLRRLAALERVYEIADEARCCQESEIDGHSCRGMEEIRAALAAVPPKEEA